MNGAEAMSLPRNNGKPWTPEDDKFLWKNSTPYCCEFQLEYDWEPDYLDGDILDLAGQLGRTPGAIRARLLKLFEEDRAKRTGM